MGINTALKNAKHSIQWNGEEAAEVRGLTPADFAAIISAEGEEIFNLFSEFDDGELASMDLNNTAQVADTLLAKAPAILSKLSTTAPRLLARIIAVAADDEESMPYVLENFSLPLQFEALSQISRLTFLGPEGFRLFVGNVQALVASVAAMTNAQPKMPRPHIEQEPTPSGDGSAMSLN